MNEEPTSREVAIGFTVRRGSRPLLDQATIPTPRWHESVEGSTDPHRGTLAIKLLRIPTQIFVPNYPGSAQDPLHYISQD